MKLTFSRALCYTVKCCMKESAIHDTGSHWAVKLFQMERISY